MNWSVILFLIFTSATAFAMIFFSNPDSIDVKNVKIFVGTILATSATILAITFSLSQYLVTRLGDLYSPYIIKYYRDSPRTKITFIAFLSTTVFSAIFLVVDYEEGLFHSAIVWTLLTGFIFSVLSFALFFIMIMKTVNPIEFAEIIKKMANEHLKNKRKIDFQNMVTSIGDTIVKSLVKHEVRISLEYIRILQKIGLNYISVKNQTEDSSENKEIEENPLFLILKQYKRAYKKAYADNESEVTRNIILMSKKLMQSTIEEKNKDELLEIFISNSPFKTFFHNIQKITSEDPREREEKKLLPNIIMFQIQSFVCPPNIELQYIEHFVPKPLFNIAQIMIDNNDCYSFKQFVEASATILKKDPMDAINVVADLIYSTRDPDLDKIHLKLYSDLKINGCWKFNDFEKYIKITDEYKNTLKSKGIESFEIIDKEIKRIRKEIWTVYESSLLHKVFFWIGAYLLFVKKPNFLEILWNVTDAEEDRTMYVNSPPISTSTTWICQILRDSNMGFDSEEPNFGEFQSPSGFMYKYFGLLQAKSSNNFDFPQTGLIERMAIADPNMLKEWHYAMVQLTSNNFVDYTKNIFKYIDIEKITKNEFGQLKINQSIKNLQEKAKETISNIIEAIPVIQDNVNECVNKSFNEYTKMSHIQEIGNVKIVTSSIERKIIHNKPIEIPKSAFTVINNFYPNFAETVSKYLTNSETESTLLAIINSKPKSSRSKFETLEIKMEKIFEEMEKKGNSPDYIIMHKNFWAEFNKLGQNYGLEIKSKKLNIEFSKHIDEKHIILVHRNSVEIKYLSQNEKRYRVDTKNDLSDKQKILFIPFMEMYINILSKDGMRRITVSGIPD